MNDYQCGFCKLVSNLPLEREKLKIVYESDSVLAFHSTMPYAETHIVIISKRHIPSIFDLHNEDNELKLEILSVIKIASQEVILLKGACKVELYLGAFQQMQHLHCHVIYDSTID
ncbi:MAG: family hydrolase [Herbinix sp.]|jgi:histidine triad (HIT) family protein|nr:family hydrolase [Herbinix sp.]